MTLSGNDLTYITNLVRARRAGMAGLAPRDRNRMSGAARAYLEEDGEELLAGVRDGGSRGEALDTLVKTLASATLSGPVTFGGAVFGADGERQEKQGP